MNQAEKFCKLNGIEWSKLQINTDGLNPHRLQPNNPTFTDAKSILEVMMKREDWHNFAGSIGGYSPSRSIKVDLYYILNPDKLLEVAIKWCEKGESNENNR